MPRPKIINSEFYFELFKFIVLKKEARSYVITKEFNPKMNNRKDFDNKNEYHKFKSNFSGKLTRLVKMGLIKKIGEKSRGRHGKYGIYTADYNKIIKNILSEFFNNDLQSFFWLTKDSTILSFFCKRTIKNIFKYQINNNNQIFKHFNLYPKDYIHNYISKTKDLDSLFSLIKFAYITWTHAEIITRIDKEHQKPLI